MSQVYLSLGSNLGDRLRNLQRAVEALARCCRVTAVSAVYETPPWGETAQPAFLNLCLAAQTSHTPHSLLTYLKYLEQSLGRRTTYRWGPRLIDIDILFFDDLVLSEPSLTIPHPCIQQRAFVLVPLVDIAPDLRHPVLAQTVAQLCARVDAQGIKRLTALWPEAMRE
ncbi:MAG: 2-amino-4-hydroxy-6-hydroxymethyldihydropteridine diphosphokinase [Anaerolineales bacterium]|nr:2-amino-4-hydroxy-6-hydroxymethyldihydropteridine diphosphokinase [Anaerolineales bacterium]